MTTTAVPPTPQAQPSAEQIERAAALRRFNLLYIYAPVVLFGLVIILLIALLLYGTLSPTVTGTREFASNLADIIIILATLPLMLLCAILPVGTVAFVLYRRKGRAQTTAPQYAQRPLWRVENFIDRVRAKVQTTAPRAAYPLIDVHAKVAYIATLLKSLKRIVMRRE